jgi:hypothetical protein
MRRLTGPARAGALDGDLYFSISPGYRKFLASLFSEVMWNDSCYYFWLTSFYHSSRGRVRWLIKSANAVPNTFAFPSGRRRGKPRLDASCVVLSVVA